MSYTKGEVRAKAIKCSCGETLAVPTGARLYLNNHGRRSWNGRAESEAEIVGFSHNPLWVRVHFEGEAKSTVHTMAWAWFHQGPRHTKWEAENP